MAGFTAFPFGHGGIFMRVNGPGATFLMEMDRQQGIALAKNIIDSLHQSAEFAGDLDALKALLPGPAVPRKVL